MSSIAVPALFAVQQAAQGGGRRILTLRFADTLLNVELHLDGSEVLAVRSALVPSWRTSLLRTGVSPTALAEARRLHFSLFQTVQYLINMGNLNADELARVAHMRLTHALVPLYWHTAVPSLLEGRTDESGDLVTRTLVQPALIEAGWYALSLSPEQRMLQPSDRFKGPLLRLIDHPRAPIEVTWRAALRGSSLGEIAQRLPLRWDVLTEHVSELIARRLLKFQGEVQDWLEEGTPEPHDLPPHSV